MRMAKRTEAQAKAQKRYEEAKAKAGEHVTISVKLKTDADRAMLGRLKERFPDKTPTGIARMALKVLDGKSNAKPYTAKKASTES